MSVPAATTAPRSRLSWIWTPALCGLLLISCNELSATRLFRWPWWLAGLVVCGLPLIGLLRLAVTGRLSSPGRSLVFAGTVLTGIAFFSSAAVSPYARDAFILSLLPFGALATGICAWHALAPHTDGFTHRLARWQTVIGAFFLVLALESLALWLCRDVGPAWTASRALRAAFGPEAASFSLPALRNLHPFGHANYTAGAAVLMLPWFGGLAWTRRGRARALWLGAAVLALALLLSSGSRGGLLGLVVSAGAATALAVGRGGPRARRIALGCLVTGLVFLAAHPRLRETVASLADDTRMPSSSDAERSAMIAAGLQLGADRPLSGWGTGTTPLVFPARRASLGLSLENSFQLHSEPVTLWAENGGPVLLGLGLLLAGLAASTRRALQTGGAVGAAALPAALALIGYGAFSLTDSQLDVPWFAAAVAVLAAVVAACGSAGQPPRPAASRRWRAVTAGLVVVTLLTVAAAALPSARYRCALAVALEDFDAGRTAEFAQKARTLLTAHPREFPLVNLLASLAMDAALASPDSAGRQANAAQAVAWLERSLAIEPGQEFAHFNLGWLLWETDPARALAEFEAAARIVPDKRGVHFGRALALLKARRPGREAVAALARECLLNPTFLAEPLWNQPPFAAAWPDVSHELRRCLKRVIQAPGRPAWVAREARYYLALLNTWEKREPPLFAPVWQELATTPDRAAFFTAAPPSPAGTAPWQLLARAAAAQGPERTRLLGLACLRLHGQSPPVPPAQLVALLDRRLEAGWPAVLNPAGAPDLLQSLRNQRTAAPILARNTDLPPLRDYYRMEQPVSTAFLAFLFPRKGWCLPLEGEPLALPAATHNPPLSKP